MKHDKIISEKNGVSLIERTLLDTESNPAFVSHIVSSKRTPYEFSSKNHQEAQAYFHTEVARSYA